MNTRFPHGDFLLSDCMEVMKLYADNEFDIAIVDPPYGISYNNEKSRRGLSKNTFEDIRNDDIGITKEYIAELSRVSKNQIIFGLENCYFNIPKKGSWICWDKRVSTEADNVFGGMFELAWTSFDNSYYKIARVMHGGVINSDAPNTRRIHPTQKPIALYKWILKTFCKGGERILDTHVGSGSSLIAFEDYGFQYIGIEIEEKYFSATTERITKHLSIPKLFEEEFIPAREKRITLI